MSKIDEDLPDRPVHPEKIFELMKIPRTYGFIVPFMKDDGGRCVAAYGEKDGQFEGISYTGTRWEQTGDTVEDVDAAIHDVKTTSKVLESLESEVSNRFPSLTELYGEQIQFEAPAGFQFKMCTRHRPLSPEDHQQLSSFPQIGDVVPIWGSPGEGIVSVGVLERTPKKMNPVVFATYIPTVGTWRVVDTATVNTTPDVADHIHEETGRRASEHYSDLEMICGPS